MMFKLITFFKIPGRNGGRIFGIILFILLLGFFIRNIVRHILKHFLINNEFQTKTKLKSLLKSRRFIQIGWKNIKPPRTKLKTRENVVQLHFISNKFKIDQLVQKDEDSLNQDWLLLRTIRTISIFHNEY